MIFKFVVLLALVAAPALSSSIKGYQRSEEAAKGHRAPFSPIEQQKLIEQRAQETKGRHQLEQAKLEHVEQQKSEDYKQEQVREEQVKEEQVREELPAKGKYEAKPQLSRDELSKSSQKREELSKTSLPKVEQQKEEKLEQLPLPVSQQKEEKFDRLDQQQQQRQDFDAQIELKEEQRRLEEPAAFVQPILPLTVVEDRAEQQIEQQRYDVKGGAPAPLGEAEPYAFNYQIDGQSRSESGDTKGVVRGQYTLQGADGASRIVDYIADQNGFRASVNTNEFGTESKSAASMTLISSQPSAEDISLRLEGKTKEDYGKTSQAAAPAAKGQRETSWAEQTKGGQDWARKGADYQAKGQRLSQQHEESVLLEQAPTKSAAEPARAAKSAPHFAEQKSAAPAEQTRSGFESATAHRAYKQPASPQAPRKQAPAVLVRQLASSSLRAPAQAPAARTYAQRSHQPNPKVSFYSAPATGPVNYDEEIPSFIESEQA